MKKWIKFANEPRYWRLQCMNSMIKRNLFSILPFQWNLRVLYRSVSERTPLCNSDCHFHNVKSDVYHKFTITNSSKSFKINLSNQYFRTIATAITTKAINQERLEEISSLLKCSPEKLKPFAKAKLKLFSEFDRNEINEKILLLSYKFPKEAIIENLWILDYSTDDLKARLEEMDKWELNSIQDKLLPLLKISTLDFYRMSAKFVVERDIINHKNRIVFVANEMQCPIDRVVDRFVYFQFLLFRSFRQIRENIELLKKFDLSGEDLLNDFAILNLTPEKLRMRLEIMNKFGLSKNLWIISASEKVFNRKIDKELEKIHILDENKTIDEFICNNLRLTSEQKRLLKNAKPTIFKEHPVKVKNMLHFLLTSGYSTEEICSSINILRHDLRKIENRFKEMRKYGIERPKLKWLCARSYNYDKMLEQLKETGVILEEH